MMQSMHVSLQEDNRSDSGFAAGARETSSPDPGLVAWKLPAGGLARLLAVADDGSTDPGPAAPGQPGTITDACRTLTSASAVSSNVAFIRRGGCFFDDKVYRAQLTGAVAVIIANKQDTG
jgi:hypothetical protein